MKTGAALGIVIAWMIGNSAVAMMVALPPPAIVAGSDLVVLVTVTDEGTKAEREVVPPGGERPLKRWYQESGMKVDEVCFAKGRWAPGVEPGDVIRVVSWTKPPPPKNAGGPFPMVADGPTYVSFRQGQKYLLVLRAMPDGKAYYLQPDPRLFIMDTPNARDRIDALRKVADAESWPWGEAVSGLQLACVPERDEFVRSRTRQGGRNGPVSLSSRIGFVAVVRNVSREPVALAHFPADRYLMMTANAPGKQAERVDLYKGMQFREPFGQGHVSVVEPGDMVMLARYGKGPYGEYQALEAPPGRLHLGLVYESKREGVGPNGLPLWRGKLVSGMAEVTIVR